MMHQRLEILRSNASACRELASTAMTPEGKDALTDLAEDYERKIITLEVSAAVHPRRRPAFRWPLS